MIVVVTGTSAGVGRAPALEFARRGHDVAILARNQQRLEAAAAEIRREDVKAPPIVADVADFAAVDAAATAILHFTPGLVEAHRAALPLLLLR